LEKLSELLTQSASESGFPAGFPIADIPTVYLIDCVYIARNEKMLRDVGETLLTVADDL
jgi:hypothetical protein